MHVNETPIGRFPLEDGTFAEMYQAESNPKLGSYILVLPSTKRIEIGFHYNHETPMETARAMFDTAVSKFKEQHEAF